MFTAAVGSTAGRPMSQKRLVDGGATVVADQQATEEAEPLVTALEPVAELVEVGLQMRGPGVTCDDTG